jgi:hypothetical protein
MPTSCCELGRTSCEFQAVKELNLRVNIRNITEKHLKLVEFCQLVNKKLCDKAIMVGVYSPGTILGYRAGHLLD